MKTVSFYNSIDYKKRQSEIAKKNWQKGIYDSLYKRERRQCVSPYCKEWFETKLAEPKKFCSRKCAAQVNNPKRSNISFETKEEITRLYQKGLSMKEIVDKMGWSVCGVHKVKYWLDKSNIPRRSSSEAAYVKWNPNGDPFKIKKKLTRGEIELRGLGLGIYWGEGNKINKHSVRVGNSDPKLIKIFRDFLLKICGVKNEKIGYSLLLFNDANKEDAVNFWSKNLGITLAQIRSITSLKPRGEGTYKKKSMTGVLMIYVGNIKLKKEIDKMLMSVK